MKHTIVIGLAILLVPAAIALAARASVPGGPAPKALLGTWRTTLTRTDEARSANPAEWPTQLSFQLVIRNTGGSIAPRLLGLHPAGEGGDSYSFGVRGHTITMQCLAGALGLPAPGYGTYAWSIRGTSLTMKLVKEPCRDKETRNRITILTSHPWRKAG
jgi:hypothetical protein